MLAALEQIGSKSCAIFRSLSLSRDHIRRAIKMFKGKRRCQVVLSSIICATRFKAFAEGGGLLEVRCLKCGEVDSFDHLLKCTGVHKLPTGGTEQEVLGFLVALTREAVKYAPVWPSAVEKVEPMEISLQASEEEEDQDLGASPSGHENSLSFD